MELNPDDFNQFLAFIGQKYSWRKSFTCPCTNPHSGAAKQNCKNCKGKGHFWNAALTGITGVASAKVQKNWAQSGRYETGDSVLSVPSDTPLYFAGQFDRVLLLNATEEFSVTLTRGQDDVFPYPVNAIKRVFWLDQSGNVIDGGIPAVSDSGVISWGVSPSPNAPWEPPADTQYSVSGVKILEYFIFDTMPSNRGEHSGALLPRNMVLRRFDVFNR